MHCGLYNFWGPLVVWYLSVVWSCSLLVGGGLQKSTLFELLGSIWEGTVWVSLEGALLGVALGN